MGRPQVVQQLLPVSGMADLPEEYADPFPDEHCVLLPGTDYPGTAAQ